MKYLKIAICESCYETNAGVYCNDERCVFCSVNGDDELAAVFDRGVLIGDDEGVDFGKGGV